MRVSKKMMLPLFCITGLMSAVPAAQSQEEDGDSGVTFDAANVGSLSFGGDYDFSYKHVNNMRKAWLICATTAFQEGDCPDVFEKCHKPPLLERRNGRLRSKCPKPPTFSDLQADAQQALRDAARFAGVPDVLGDASNTVGAALQMVETVGSAETCKNSIYADLCEQAMALDRENSPAILTEKVLELDPVIDEGEGVDELEEDGRGLEEDDRR